MDDKYDKYKKIIIDEYNNLPYEEKLLPCAFAFHNEIRRLEYEKDRAKKSYQRHISEINELIKNLKEEFIRVVKESGLADD